MRTAVEDLRGVGRLMAAAPIARFAAVGVVSTIAHALLFLALVGLVGAVAANAVALALTAIGNTAANRRFPFRVRGRAGLLRHHLRGGLVFVLTLALTNCALLVLHGLDASPAQAVELAVLVAANLTATVTRYVAMRTWVFAQRRRSGLLAHVQGSVAAAVIAHADIPVMVFPERSSATSPAAGFEVALSGRMSARGAEFGA